MRTMVVVAVLAGLAAAGAGAFAWMQHQELRQTKSALNNANTELQKTRSDLKVASDELVSLRKQYAEQQMALNQLQAEMANARTFLEAEKAVSARLREDMAKMKEDFATALRAARSSQARPAGPMLYDPPKPMVIQGRRGVQAVNPQPAQ